MTQETPIPRHRSDPVPRNAAHLLLSPFTATESLNPIYKSVSNQLLDSVGHRNWRQKSTERLKTLHDTALTLPRGGALHDPRRTVPAYACRFQELLMLITRVCVFKHQIRMTLIPNGFI